MYNKDHTIDKYICLLRVFVTCGADGLMISVSKWFIALYVLLILRGVFTPYTKMLVWMEQDAQLKKAFFSFSLPLCICDALNSVCHNELLNLFF